MVSTKEWWGVLLDRDYRTRDLVGLVTYCVYVRINVRVLESSSSDSKGEEVSSRCLLVCPSEIIIR